MKLVRLHSFLVTMTVLAVAMLCLPSGLFAQADANKAQIVGTVLDPGGAAVPGAKVSARNVATGAFREATTSNDGLYRLVALDAGTYEITVAAAGFSETKLTDVVLSVGSAITLNPTMSVAGTSTVIEVGETMISDVQTSLSASVNSNAITNLPINGRRFQDFAQLMPTVQVTSATRNQLSFAGQRGIYSNIMLDGGDYNQPFFGGIRGGERSNSIITVPQAAIQEFQVVPTGYTAEYGRSTGGVMNAITKSGTNDLHGQAFFQARPREASLQNPIPINLPTGRQKVTPSETLYQYGGAVGGAIKKDRVFWLTSAEAQRAETPRQVFFPGLTGVTPTAANQEAFNYFKSLEGPFNQTNRATAALGRLDFNLSNGDRITLRYNWSDSIEKNAVTVGGDLNPFSNSSLAQEGQELDTIHNGAFQYTKLFGARAVNDFRFIGSAEVRPRLSNAMRPGLNVGLVGLDGTRSFLPTTQSDKRWQFADALSISAGQHNFKVGFDYNYLTASQSFGFNQFGFFTISGGTAATNLQILSAGGAAGNRFDTTTVSYNRQIGNTLAAFNMHQIAFFAQDNWRLARNFSLDFGLRYETQLNPQPDSNNTALVNTVKDFPFPIGMTLDPTTIQNARNQWMPRVGFAWTPFEEGGRTVVRGNFGVFYAATPLLSFAGPNNNFRTPPGDVSLALTSVGGRTVYQAFQAAGVDLNRFPIGELPNIPIETVQQASAFMLTGSTGGPGRDPFAGANLLTMAQDFRNPRSVQAGVGFDTELARNFTVGLQLNLVNTVRLMRNREFNLPAPRINPGDQSGRPNFGVRSIAGLPTQLRPIASLGSITARDSSARGLYRAATIRADYRARRFQFQGFYTFSENFSNDDSERDATGFQYTNTFNLQNEYGPSNLDFRHQWTSNAVYQMPWGFELGAIYRYRTGFPMTPRTNGDENQDNNFNDRPYLSPGREFGRNSFRNRPFQTFDLRLMKNFNFTERQRIQFSVEFFNLFNTHNVVFAGQGNIYGPGFLPGGAFAPVDPRFQRLRGADGEYDALTTEQLGKPMQAQFGVRYFF
jgi:hypothetical protein